MQESVEFKGTIIDLKSRLNEQRGRYFDIEWTNKKEFKFLAPLTNGTAMVKGNPGLIDEIKGYAVIVEERENGITKIEMSTKFRIELKSIIGFGIVFIFYAINTFKIIPIILIATIFLSPLHG